MRLRAPTLAELKPTRQALHARRSRFARGQRYLLGATPPAGIFVGYRAPVRAVPIRVFSLFGGSALPCHLDLIRFLSFPHCRAVVRFAGSLHLPLLHDPCRGLSSGSAPACAVSFGWGPRPSLERFVGPPPLLSVPARYARALGRGLGQGRAVSRFAGRFFSADALWPKNAGLALRATVPRETLGTAARVFGHKAPALLALIYLESLIEIVYTTTSPHPTTAGVVFDENSLYDICERKERTRA